MTHTFQFHITNEYTSSQAKNIFCSVRYIVDNGKVYCVDIQVPTAIFPLINAPIALTDDIQRAAENNAISMGLIPAPQMHPVFVQIFDSLKMTS